MEKSSSFYFVAIVLPVAVCEEVNAFKLDFANRFGSTKALRVVPHITLKAPFQQPAAEHQKTLDWFAGMKVNVLPFKQELRNFDAFSGKWPVIYINAVMNSALATLQKDVVQSHAVNWPKQQLTHYDNVFRPHITLAYRDLVPAAFERAWQEYRMKTYSADFTVKSFELLQHNGSHWHVLSSKSLDNNPLR